MGLVKAIIMAEFENIMIVNIFHLIKLMRQFFRENRTKDGDRGGKGKKPMLKRIILSAMFIANLLFLMAGAALAHGQEIQVEPEIAGPGETVTMSGHGFEANSTVKITLHGHDGTLKVAQTDAQGAFRVDALIPEHMPDGVHMLIVRDKTNEMAQFRLTVDASINRWQRPTALIYIVGSVSILLLAAGIVGLIISRKSQQATATA